MVTTGDMDDSRYQVAPGGDFNGVARIVQGSAYGTGTLLFGGRAVLTAAHLLVGQSGAATVAFSTEAGTFEAQASHYLIHPAYDPIQGNNDIAILWLDRPAPVSAQRYELYRNSDEIGHIFKMVGYGLTGTGAIGTQPRTVADPARLQVSNQFDAEGYVLKAYLGGNMAWYPLRGTQLIADFDDGSLSHDALGQLMARPDLGLGPNEGLIAPGDSGGPAFIGGALAGVASYVASLSSNTKHPDVDSVTNSSFGEVAAWQRVSHFQAWIDQSLRANLPNPPITPQEVVKSIAEGNSCTSYAYFLLQFNGVRAEPDQVLSVDYATRDGSAQAGSDYLATSGRLNLYPGENQAVIAVEIVGDAIPEPDETFYLDVSNPVGGHFPDGLLTLTAVRTIVDDDGLPA